MLIGPATHKDAVCGPDGSPLGIDTLRIDLVDPLHALMADVVPDGDQTAASVGKKYRCADERACRVDHLDTTGIPELFAASADTMHGERAVDRVSELGEREDRSPLSI